MLIFAIRTPLLDVNDPALIYYDTVTTALAWGVGYVIFSRARLTGIALTALPVALFAFVLHDMINFAAFVPGVGTTCFALIALAVSTRTTGWKPVPHQGGKPVPHAGERPRDLRRYAIKGVFGVVVATIAVVGFVAFPMGGAGAQALARARQARTVRVSHPDFDLHPAYRAYREAGAIDPLDPTPLVELAKWLARTAWRESDRRHALDAAIDALDSARVRDPHNGGLDRLSARLLLRRAAGEGNAAHYHRAVESARRALASYPTDPRAMILLADCLLSGGRTLDDHAMLREAIEHLEAAVKIDAKRPNWEVEVRRLSDLERADIQTRIDRARAILDAQTP